jgi:hypothetical protein
VFLREWNPFDESRRTVQARTPITVKMMNGSSADASALFHFVVQCEPVESKTITRRTPLPGTPAIGVAFSERNQRHEGGEREQ